MCNSNFTDIRLKNKDKGEKYYRQNIHKLIKQESRIACTSCPCSLTCFGRTSPVKGWSLPTLNSVGIKGRRLVGEERGDMNEVFEELVYV